MAGVRNFKAQIDEIGPAQILPAKKEISAREAGLVVRSCEGHAENSTYGILT